MGRHGRAYQTCVLMAESSECGFESGCDHGTCVLEQDTLLLFTHEYKCVLMRVQFDIVAVSSPRS